MPEPVTILGFGAGVLGLSAHLARRYFDVAKEVFDVMLGCVLLIGVLPLMGLCAVLIKLSDGGSVVYRQVRLGRNGKAFTMYKLRSMYNGSEQTSGAVWAERDDPRVMRLCRWMRWTHVDELPQLVNVIKGDMSLIGPRPERPEIMVELEKAYPEVRKRLAVRPGITGLAQVRNGYDTSVEAFRHKLVSDLEYIEKRRWSSELWILAATATKLVDREAH